MPEGTSVSYIVDRTVEHYQMVIMKRMKERKRIEQKEKYLQDQRSQQGHPTTVTLVSWIFFLSFYDGNTVRLS